MVKIKNIFSLLFVLLPKSNLIALCIGYFLYLSNDEELKRIAYYLSYFVILLLAMRVSIIFHELGHYFASLIAKTKSRRVILGLGKEIKRFKLNGTSFIINKNIITGANYLNLEMNDNIKLRLFISSIGGIFVNFILLFISYYIVFINQNFQNAMVVMIGKSLLVVNSIQLVFSIIPRKVSFVGVRTPNDGLLAIRAIYSKEKDIEEYRCSGKLVEFLEKYENHEYQEGLNILNNLIINFPSLIPLKINLSLVYLELGNYSKSEDILRSMLKTCESNGKYNSLIQNNLGWTLLLINDPDSIKEADKITKEAYSKNKNTYHLLGTRGCILIETGIIAEGQSLLIQAERHKHNPENGIANLGYLAYSYYLLNQYESMETYLDKAQNKYNNAKPSEKKIYDLLQKRMKFNSNSG